MRVKIVPVLVPVLRGFAYAANDNADPAPPGIANAA